jgi:hypothetical protein
MLNVTNPTNVVHPQLTALLALLTPLHKSEFPVDIKTRGSGMYFTDSRHPLEYPEYSDYEKILGAVEWDGEKQTFLVHSHRIKVTGRKPRRGTAKVRNTKRTKSLKNAVKLVLENFVPFTESEFMRVVGGNPRGDIAQWVLEADRQVAGMTNSVPGSVLLEEVSHLLTQGVQFKTDWFRKIAQQGMEMDEERKRRMQSRDASTIAFVRTEPDGRVSCTYVSTGSTLAIPVSKTDVGFPNEDALPTVIQDKIALLRFADENTFVPEVGRRVHKAFWVVLSVDELQAACAAT